MARSLERLGYFLPAILREYLPGASTLAQLRLAARLPRDLGALDRDSLDRVAYYNQLPPQGAPLPGTRLGDMRARDASSSEILYHIDLMRHAQGFGPDFRLNRLFGDVIHIPDQPSIVKSRPIAGDLTNSILMPLDVLRHLHFPADPVPWSRKKPFAVWRGRSNNQPPRIAAARIYADHPDHDIGQIDHRPDLPAPKAFLSIPDQLNFRYVLSLEGNDVATNLKWIMGSNSVALSPKLEFETWYMEGRLVPGEHFVEIAPDLSDLDDRIAWCESNPQEVQQIIRNAQAWTQPFRDRKREALIASLVLLKYAERTGGAAFIAPKTRLFST